MLNEDKYLALDQELNTLLGRDVKPIIRYTKNSRAAFDLMVEQGIDLDFGNVYIRLAYFDASEVHYEAYEDHTSKRLAVRCAIVKVVIEKLKHRST